MATTASITTAEQLLAAGDIGRCELIRGELFTLAPAGGEHGDLAMELGWRVTSYVKAHRLGKTYAAETGFILERNPDTVRAPDVAFIAAANLRPKKRRGFIDGAPDLAAEVLSPDDGAGYVLDKAQQWLAAGARLVWIVDPRTCTVSVHRRGSNQVTVLRESDTLGGEDVLPGFELPLHELFDAE